MDLTHLRKKIDSLDARIVALLNERAGITLSIGQEKLKNKRSIYAPEREKQVLARIRGLNQGPLSKQSLEAVYREIMSGSLSLEKSLRIAHLGPKASYTQMAALRKFGRSVEYIACDNIPDVFNRVEHGDCDYGVVPVENSNEGAVTHTFDMLVDSDLKICSQTLMPIAHHLLANVSMNKIKQIYSNPQVFGQCRQWLMMNMPKAELIDAVSSARAAQITAKKKNAACVASELAAQVYGLKILKRNIQDNNAHNITRFLVLSKLDAGPTGRDRTSLVFSIKDKVGALHAMLTPFYKNKINLTKIESRPSKKKAWDYYFFVDCEGHQKDKAVARALGQLEGMCKFMKILGSYPVLDQ
ncbi:MAG TPA: prephenate dehydratase [Candidatus Omnitrophota bacterium]|nr:prephenate dehydratase [Candidatus Omnitrophota bacterium]